MKTLLIDFSKSYEKIYKAYMHGEMSIEEWRKQYEQLLDNYEKKIWTAIIKVMEKEKV